MEAEEKAKREASVKAVRDWIGAAVVQSFDLESAMLHLCDVVEASIKEPKLSELGPHPFEHGDIVSIRGMDYEAPNMLVVSSIWGRTDTGVLFPVVTVTWFDHARRINTASFSAECCELIARPERPPQPDWKEVWVCWYEDAPVFGYHSKADAEAEISNIIEARDAPPVLIRMRGEVPPLSKKE